ncbi:MAG: HAMP domain-containing histidine kinase [Odoribacter sp.]|nr:HAMP domain-containing histidine kinase [Odoribacter sp.]
MTKKQIIVLGTVLGLALIGLVLIQAQYFSTAFELKKAQFDDAVNRTLGEVVAYIEDVDRIKQAEEGKSVLEGSEIIFGDSIGIYPQAIIKSGQVLKLTDYEDDELSNKDNQIFSTHSPSGMASSLLKYQKIAREQFQQQAKYNALSQDFDKYSRSLETQLKGIDLNVIIGERLRDNGIKTEFQFAIKEDDRFIIMSEYFVNRQSEYTYRKRMFARENGPKTDLYLTLPIQMQDKAGFLWILIPNIVITIILMVSFMYCLIVIVRQKRLSAIKNDFINNMTHEFKTPISTISLASQMLKEENVKTNPETIAHISDIIKDESKRLTFQVEKVLQSALFTDSRIRLKLKNVHMNELVENQLNKFCLKVEDKGGKLLWHLDAEQDEVYVDDVYMTNVITNLLDNAIKYCVETPEIGVYTRNKEENIIISVIDNGIGIAAKDQKLIFERFYRVSTGNLHDVKGFGLGLPYVKTIVEAHYGKVQLESVLNKGSRFDIILPLCIKKKK